MIPAQIPTPARISPVRDKSSVFSSLDSLFVYLGIFEQAFESHGILALGDKRSGNGTKKFAVIRPVIREFEEGDRFALDCFRYLFIHDKSALWFPFRLTARGSTEPDKHIFSPMEPFGRDRI